LHFGSNRAVIAAADQEAPMGFTAALTDDDVRFIAEQKIFFVATAVETGRINLSPKGMDSFAVLGLDRVAWLNVTGSGNETSAHVQVAPRMTLMFCAFAGKPNILRIYGNAKAVHRADLEWPELAAKFPPLPGTRQIFDIAVESVQNSCGMSIPFYDYVGERDQLNEWARKKGEDGVRDYWTRRNQTSIDGLPTHILEKSG
jgi:hypothetical protein